MSDQTKAPGGTPPAPPQVAFSRQLATQLRQPHRTATPAAPRTDDLPWVRYGYD